MESHFYVESHLQYNPNFTFRSYEHVDRPQKRNDAAYFSRKNSNFLRFACHFQILFAMFEVLVLMYIFLVTKHFHKKLLKQSSLNLQREQMCFNKS